MGVGGWGKRPWRKRFVDEQHGFREEQLDAFFSLL